MAFSLNWSCLRVPIQACPRDGTYVCRCNWARMCRLSSRCPGLSRPSPATPLASPSLPVWLSFLVKCLLLRIQIHRGQRVLYILEMWVVLCCRCVYHCERVLVLPVITEKKGWVTGGFNGCCSVLSSSTKCTYSHSSPSWSSFCSFSFSSLYWTCGFRTNTLSRGKNSLDEGQEVRWHNPRWGWKKVCCKRICSRHFFTFDSFWSQKRHTHNGSIRSYFVGEYWSGSRLN